jgi:hypothetical protein
MARISLVFGHVAVLLQPKHPIDGASFHEFGMGADIQNRALIHDDDGAAINERREAV